MFDLFKRKSGRPSRGASTASNVSDKPANLPIGADRTYPGPQIVSASKTSETSPFHYSHNGWCPVCERSASFRSNHSWFRDFLTCSNCGSIPRERAVALVIAQVFPNYLDLKIHESSPSNRGVSLKLKGKAKNYIATQYFPNQPPGEVINGFRNENLEKQTFEDALFDIVVSLDVMEHVNHADKVFQEVSRTLKPGGAYIFTAPTYKQKVNTERRALYTESGIQHFVAPEYHGNPVSDLGALVTYHLGYDYCELINLWSGLNVELRRFHNHHLGLIGDFTEVYICYKKKGD